MGTKEIRQLVNATSFPRGSLVTITTAVNVTGKYTSLMLIFFVKKYWKIQSCIEHHLAVAELQHVMNAPMNNYFLNFNIIYSVCEMIYSIMRNCRDGRNDCIVVRLLPPYTSHKLESLKIFHNQSVGAVRQKNVGRTFDIYLVAEIL